MTPEHTIAALCQRSRDISLEKGWLNPDGTDPRPFHTVIALFHSELSEALEEVRNNKSLNETYYEATLKGADGTLGGPITPDTKVTLKSGELLGKSYVGMPKPCGILTELADFVIRVCQWAGSNGCTAGLATAFGEVLPVFERAGSYDVEVLIASAHAKCSLAFLASTSALPRAHEQDPVNHMAAALSAVFSFCMKKDIDIWAAIDEKEAYNRTRSHKHGGKKV